MGENKVLKAIGGFAGVTFLLLGVLFGMQIMTFIFAQLGPNSASTIEDISATVTNETGAWLNTTTYTVNNAVVKGFNNLIITEAFNDTDATLILITNFTVSGGGFTNTSTSNWNNVSVSYTYSLFSDQRNAVDDVNNNSLQSIISYTGQSDTQMTTVGIAITLAILIALFSLFWTFFIKSKTGKDSGDSVGGNFS